MLVDGKYGTLSFAPFITIRYLNQKALNDDYTDDFGRTYIIDKRNDIQFQKRINPEVIYEENSPVGYTSYPTVVGAKGTIFMLNLELFY